MKYIFIHGLGQNSLSWSSVISFMPKEFNLGCPDLFSLIGDEEVNYFNLYKSFSEYCNNISEPLNLCGLSLGGILALNYAIEYPDKVNSLVLIGTQYKMPKTLLKFQNIIFRLMGSGTFEKMGVKKKDIISLTNSMVDLDFSNSLKDVFCETLILCGEKDSANKKASMYLEANIKNAKMQIIENAGHEVNLEAPEKLALQLKMFY